MLLSVVVSAFSLGRIGDLIDLLDGLAKQTYREMETIVIIDESHELFSKISDYTKNNHYNNVRTVFNPCNNGLSYSRNLGIENATGEVIAFIDDDAVPYSNWADSIVKTFEEDETIGAVTGDIIPLWENEDMSWFPKELHWMISCSYVMTPTVKQEFERGFGANMSFRKVVFDKVGFFDTNFGINGKKWVGGEDTDMFLRVKKLGMKIVFNPGACVHHKIYKYRIQTKNIIKRAYNGGFSVALMKNELQYKMSDSTENEYLKHLLFKFYPAKITSLLNTNRLIELKAINAVTLVIISETFGFCYGIIYNHIPRKSRN
jgi:GT2 family glycosyltransferase